MYKERRRAPAVSTGKSQLAFPDNYIVVDVETTGLYPDRDRLIEIGAEKVVQGEVVDTFSSLLQPKAHFTGQFVSPFITRLTGITNAMLQEAPAAQDVLGQFTQFVGDELLLGYNVGFDAQFLAARSQALLGTPILNDYVDILIYAQTLHPEEQGHRLADMVRLYGLTNENAHRALSDVDATRLVYGRLRAEALAKFGTEEAFFKEVCRAGYHAEEEQLSLW